MHQHEHMATEKPQVIVRCTQGSFIEAINTVNAGVKALENLQRVELGAHPSHIEIAKAELRSIVHIALGRISAEAVCTENLEASFKESYRLVLMRAKQQSQAGVLSKQSLKRVDAALAALKAMTATKLANPAAK
jgi:hypothetical protein